MGDDGETFSSSNFDKPSFEGASEQKHSIGDEKLNGGELNDAEQCEFMPKSGGANVSPFDLKEREGLAEEAGQGGVQETGDMHAADDVEDKMGAEAEIGGGGEGPVLKEKVGGENSDFTGVDETVMNEEGHVEVLAVQAGPVVAAEEVDTVEFKEGATTVGDREKDDSDMGVIVERRHDTVVDEVEAVVEGGKLITEADNLQSTAADESGTVEEDVEMVVTPVESSLVLMGAEKELESAEGKETNAEEMLTAEDKVDAEAVIEVTEEESNAEFVTGLQGLEFVGYESPNLPKEEMNQMGGKEGLVADTEMDDIKGTEELENFRPNDLQYNSQESVIVVDDEAKKEWLPEGIPIADSVLEEEKEAEIEAIKVGNDESIRKPDDADFIRQDDEDDEMVAEEECAVADMGMENKTDVLEERRLLGTGKEAETEVEVGDVESIPNTDDAKLVPQDEDKKIVANEEPALIGSEMETKTDAGEEPRVLEQGEEAETKIAEFGDDVSIPKIDDAKLVSLDEEDGETVAEEGSALAGMEMETQTGTGEEKTPLILEKEKEAETEAVKVDNVEYIPEIDDAKHVPQDEGDEEMAAEEESALADTEMETETDVGESSRAVGEKHKRGRNSKVLTNSKTLSKAQKIMEEDVCFICFDGGDLVLCDRR